MSEVLAAGIYKAKILDYGIKADSKGNASPTVAFLVKDAHGADQKVYWQGSFNGGGLPIAMEALLVMGLQGSDQLETIADGTVGAALDMTREYLITVEQQPSVKDPTKIIARVAWINSDGATKFKDAMDRTEFSKQILGRNLKAELVRIAAEKGFNLSSGAVRPKAEIPF